MEDKWFRFFLHCLRWPDWLKQFSLAARSVKRKSTTQIWVVTRRQYGISALVSQTSLREEIVVASRNVGCFSGRLRTVEFEYTE